MWGSVNETAIDGVLRRRPDVSCLAVPAWSSTPLRGRCPNGFLRLIVIRAGLSWWPIDETRGRVAPRLSCSAVPAPAQVGVLGIPGVSQGQVQGRRRERRPGDA
jgi:hypothetical protein